MIVLWIYLLLTLLVAAWLGWLMKPRLDAFDWRYRSGDIWFSFCLSLLLWPLLMALRPGQVLRGKVLFPGTGDKVFDTSGSLANRMRELDQIARNPPRCGQEVIYHHPHSFLDGQDATPLVFRASDIESHFKRQKLPLSRTEEASALVAFIKNRDDTRQEATAIPGAIDFEDMAVQLMEHGYGIAECRLCATRYPADQLQRFSSSSGMGWVFETYACPKGHNLFNHQVMHILV